MICTTRRRRRSCDGTGDPVGGQPARQQGRRNPDSWHGRRSGQDRVVDAAHGVGRPERAGLAEGVRQRERRARRHALTRPARRVDDVQHLGVDAERRQPVGDRLQHAARCRRARLRPNQPCPTAVFGAGAKNVEQVAPGRGQTRVTRGRTGDQQRRVAHQLPVVDDVAERLLPGVAEQDGVVAESIVGPTARHPTWATTADGAGRSGNSLRGVRPSSR